MEEAKGFEPLDTLRINSFQDYRLKPLGQTSYYLLILN